MSSHTQDTCRTLVQPGGPVRLDQAHHVCPETNRNPSEPDLEPPSLNIATDDRTTHIAALIVEMFDGRGDAVAEGQAEAEPACRIRVQRNIRLQHEEAARFDIFVVSLVVVVALTRGERNRAAANQGAERRIDGDVRVDRVADQEAAVSGEELTRGAVRRGWTVGRAGEDVARATEAQAMIDEDSPFTADEYAIAMEHVGVRNRRATVAPHFQLLLRVTKQHRRAFVLFLLRLLGRGRRDSGRGGVAGRRRRHRWRDGWRDRGFRSYCCRRFSG